MKGIPSGGTEVEELWQDEAIWTLKCKVKWIADKTAIEDLAGGTTQKDSRLGSLIILSGIVYTRVEVCRMDSEISGLVEQSWFQLICYTICLLCGHNFR